jgi:hypothetical protein
MTVRLPRLEDRIKVFRNGGPAFGLGVSDPEPAHAELVGVYELVGPVGPETPVYIPTRGI